MLAEMCVQAVMPSWLPQLLSRPSVDGGAPAAPAAGAAREAASAEEELRCVIAVVRHGDRTPKQKLKLASSHPAFLRLFSKWARMQATRMSNVPAPYWEFSRPCCVSLDCCVVLRLFCLQMRCSQQLLTCSFSSRICARAV